MILAIDIVSHWFAYLRNSFDICMAVFFVSYNQFAYVGTIFGTVNRMPTWSAGATINQSWQR